MKVNEFDDRFIRCLRYCSTRMDSAWRRKNIIWSPVICLNETNAMYSWM